MIKHFETSVRVTGRGSTRSQAFADALSGVQRAVIAGSEQVLLRIEPQQISVVEAIEIKRIEKFLFFFLPRERIRCSVKLDVTVNVTAIDLEKVNFTARIDKSL